MATLDALVQGVVGYLAAYPGLTALVSDRICRHPLPEDRVFPCVSYQVESVTPLHVAKWARPHFRFSCWSYTYTLSLQIAEQVRKALESYHGDFGTVHAFSMVEDMRDGTYEPAPGDGIWPVHVYVRFWFSQDS